MKKRIIIAISTSIVLIFLFYCIFLHNKAPQALDGRYLKATTRIEVNIAGKNETEPYTIQDPKKIAAIVSSFFFERLPAGEGLGCAAKYQVKFITPSQEYNMYFGGCNETAEISFFPQTIFTKWENWNVGAGTIVPVYKTFLSSDVYCQLTGKKL